MEWIQYIGDNGNIGCKTLIGGNWKYLNTMEHISGEGQYHTYNDTRGAFRPMELVMTNYVWKEGVY